MLVSLFCIGLSLSIDLSKKVQKYTVRFINICFVGPSDGLFNPQGSIALLSKPRLVLLDSPIVYLTPRVVLLNSAMV